VLDPHFCDNQQMFPETFYGKKLFLLLLLLLAGCSRSPVYLMPTPELMRDDRFDVFVDNPYLEDVSHITTFYATTRAPAKSGDPKIFSKNRGEALILGRATLKIGDDGDAWRSIYAQSVSPDKDERVALTLVDTEREVSIDLESPVFASENEAAAYFATLNSALDASNSKVLTVFVHGVNNTFYESVARGAQLQFFTGNRNVALTFAWPSGGSIWRYGRDTRYADRSIGDFALLLKLLARYSTAKHINVIGHSAGGAVVGGALAQLGREFPDPAKKFGSSGWRRIHEVYLAASDEGLHEFEKNLPQYLHLVDTVTVTVNPDDHVLQMAGIAGGEVRLGEAGGGGYAKSMTEAQQQNLRELANNGKLDVIDMQINDIEGFKYSHSAWYENPWVSTDVLVTLYIGLDPDERGLRSYQTELDMKAWYFPKDYLPSLEANLVKYFE
jgi:esterase/lipase superfamily enzyme